jgi:hypothetical protein
MLLYSLLTALHAVPAALAIAHDGPQQTAVALDLLDKLGWTPKPTEPAAIPFGEPPNFNFRNIRRQAFVSNTCGFQSGQSAGAFTCSSGYGCAYQSPEYFGCCSLDNGGTFGSDCTPYTGCYGPDADCTGACSDNNLVW